MTSDPIFPLPIADRLCAALREVVGEFGGPGEFFDKLSDHPSKFTDSFLKDKRSLGSALLQCLEDVTFRLKMLSRISATSDREFLERFLEGWDVWGQLEPEDDHWLRLALAGAPLEELLGAIPHRANEFFRCTSAVQLDSYFEDLRVKSAIQLGYPDKKLGGDGVLVLSAPLSGYIESIRLVLRSLLLHRTELSLFKVPKGSRIVPRITRELEELKEIVEKLQEQFGQMN